MYRCYDNGDAQRSLTLLARHCPAKCGVESRRGVLLFSLIFILFFFPSVPYTSQVRRTLQQRRGTTIISIPLTLLIMASAAVVVVVAAARLSGTRARASEIRFPPHHRPPATLRSSRRSPRWSVDLAAAGFPRNYHRAVTPTFDDDAAGGRERRRQRQQLSSLPPPSPGPVPRSHPSRRPQRKPPGRAAAAAALVAVAVAAAPSSSEQSVGHGVPVSDVHVRTSSRSPLPRHHRRRVPRAFSALVRYTTVTSFPHRSCHCLSP